MFILAKRCQPLVKISWRLRHFWVVIRFSIHVNKTLTMIILWPLHKFYRRKEKMFKMMIKWRKIKFFGRQDMLNVATFNLKHTTTNASMLAATQAYGRTEGWMDSQTASKKRESYPPPPSPQETAVSLVSATVLVTDREVIRRRKLLVLLNPQKTSSELHQNKSLRRSRKYL